MPKPVDRTWSAIVGFVDSVAQWRPARFAKVVVAGFLAGAASSPFVQADVGGALVVSTWCAAAVAYRAADVHREHHRPAARAARAATAARQRLQAIDAAARADTAARRAQHAARGRARRAQHTEWEWAALVADGGVLQRPATAQQFAFDSRYRQPYPPGNSTPRCWCDQYGADGHHWSTHTRRPRA